MNLEAVFGGLLGAAAGVGFPAAIAWRLLALLEKRLTSMDKRLAQIAILLAASAPPNVRSQIEDLTGGNGLGKGAA